MKSFHLQKGDISRIIRPMYSDSLPPFTKSLLVEGNGYVELTDRLDCTEGLPTLRFFKNSQSLYLMEKYPYSDIYGSMIYPDADISDVLTTYEPPTPKQIFENWARIGNSNGYYPSGTTPTGEAAQWFWENNQVVCKDNTTYVTGFVSTDEMGDYDSDVVMSGGTLASGSPSTDNDYVVFIMAFTRIGSTNHILAVTVDRQANAGVRVVYGNRSVISSESIPPNTVDAGRGTQIAKHSNSISSGAWGTSNYVRIRVVRSGDVFTIYTSSISKDKIPVLHDTQLVVDVTKHSKLDWLRGPVRYGYGCQSQEATFGNLVFLSLSNDKNTIFNADNGDVWRWTSGEWQKDTSVKAWDVLYYPRLVTSVTGVQYRVYDGFLYPL